ncbi:MAG: hypothetical protein JSR64_11015, partial [Nitrospira sp.]|nr:hypothetical protein [Nitrospira sp.]
MSRSGPSVPLGATGRADLLRALALRERTQLALDYDAEVWFGYVRRDVVESIPGEPVTVPLPLLSDPEPALAPAGKPALQMPFLHMIVQREAHESPVQAEKPLIGGLTPLAPDNDPDAAAPSPKRLIEYENLVPMARLLPALRRHLGARRAGSLDLELLIQRYAARDLPRHLPRRRLQRWHPELVVVLDFCPRLWPYRMDMHRLAERLLRLCGQSGLSMRIVNHGPLGPWSDWCAHQDRQLKSLPRNRPWRMPPAGTPVLLVSDLGLLTGPDSAPYQAWMRFIGTLRCAQARPVALVPLGAEQLHASLTNRLPVLRWSPDAPAHPVRTHGDGTAQPDGLDELLAMVAATCRTDPPLLRAMRKLNPVAPMNAGLEGALWCHPAIEIGLAVTVKTGAAADPLQRFAEMPPDLHVELNKRRRTHHAHLRRVVDHEEMLLWASHVRESTARAESNNISAAINFMERLTALLQLPGSDPGVWLQVANGIVHRAGSLMSKAFDDELRKPISSVLNNLLNGV